MLSSCVMMAMPPMDCCFKCTGLGIRAKMQQKPQARLCFFSMTDDIFAYNFVREMNYDEKVVFFPRMKM